ncbi:MAG: zinc-dependent metalloprotease [Nitriliruptoraceae bacterium]
MNLASAIFDERWASWAASTVAQRYPVQPDAVDDLRAAVNDDLPAIDAAARRFTDLGEGLAPASVTVVGRMGWVRTNLAAISGVLEPLRARLEHRPAARQLLGIQLGAVFGLMSSKVLGQFVLPLSSAGSGGSAGQGELVVVGPNVLQLAEHSPDIAVDIRRAVLLHETTHRLQFASAPWLGDYLRELVAEYLSHARIDPDAVRRVTSDAPRIVAEIRKTGTVKPLIDAVLTEEQAEIIDQAQALMTLLEGHGNTVMFDAGEGLIGDGEHIRAVLANRRRDVTSRVLSSVFGMDAKRRQYQDGEVFVRGVLEHSGTAALNLAFRSKADLPQSQELDDPSAWLQRVVP